MTARTRTKRGLQIVATVMLGGGIAVPASAQNQPLNVDVGSCVDLATPEQRLACFEAQVEAARRASPVSPQPATSAAEAPAASSTAPAAAAAGTTIAAPSNSGLSDDKEADPPDIFAVVTELRETVPSAYLITLDNGQIWRQTVPQRYPLRVGSDVRIYYSRWRAFRLTSPERGGFIQVEQVR